MPSINYNPETKTLVIKGDFGSQTDFIKKYAPDAEHVELQQVTKIGPEAFIDFRWMTSIKIPDTVTEIGKWAF